MEKVDKYYETHVRKWVDIAKKFHETRTSRGDIATLVRDFQLQDVHPIDIDLIVEYFRRFDVIERKHVWERSPASYIYYAAVAAQAFLDRYQNRRPRSYVSTHYEKEKRAIGEIHKTVEIARGFYETLDRLLSTSHDERKKQYANLIRGIYNNEITQQTHSQKAIELGKENSQFRRDLDVIWRGGYEIVGYFLDTGSSCIRAKRAIDLLLKEINEGYIERHYGTNKMQKRDIMERLLVELHMMQTAIRDYLGEIKTFIN